MLCGYERSQFQLFAASSIYILYMYALLRTQHLRWIFYNTASKIRILPLSE